MTSYEDIGYKCPKCGNRVLMMTDMAFTSNPLTIRNHGATCGFGAERLCIKELPSAQPNLQPTCNRLATDIWDKLSEVYNMENVPDAAKSIIGDVMLMLE